MTNAGDPINPGMPPAQGLYDPRYEHDSCGVGFVVDIRGGKSHRIVTQALTVLKNLLHRGACGCEANTGDGAGILIQMPHTFLGRVCATIGISLPAPRWYGSGLVFLPTDPAQAARCQAIFEEIIREEGQNLLGWRDIPTNDAPIGASARAVEPVIKQIFIGRNADLADNRAFERRLYVIRKQVEHAIYGTDMPARKYFYVPSLSSNTIVYKGMLSADQIETMYPDVTDPAVESALALVHQRFSTNTFPSWPLAHPYRYLAHNGEINTLRGNINWMRAREALCESPLFPDLKKILPIVLEGGSDSAIFDNVLEFLVMAGRSLPHAILMMIPEAWQGHEAMSPERRAFYEYHSCLMEPWDGPASIAFTDGTIIGAVLDRNGLRPSRYYVTKDGLIIMASEVGVLDIPAENILIKERLHPGRIFLVDTAQGRIIDDAELKQALAAERPYQEWLKRHMISLDDVPPPPHVHKPDHDTVLQRQQIFGYTHEDLRILLAPMAAKGEEPVGSMGTDTSLAVLSNRPRLLYDYFKQLFAQVTNPPLDAIREELVTSMESTIGPERNLLKAEPESCHQITIKAPILNNYEVAQLRHITVHGFRSTTLSMLFPVAEGARGLEQAIHRLGRQASRVIQHGYTILILSDRGVDLEHAPIPSLLATAAVHHHLVRQGTRTKVGLLIESGDAREVHHCALLMGYGAGAINPYLAFETLDDMIRQGLLPGLDHDTAVKNYIKALNKGILKVMSKMGISTIQSYCGAQIFEAIGLDRDFVDRFFTWTPSRIGGVGLDVIAEETLRRHRRAFPTRLVAKPDLEWGGEYQWRREGEYHLFNPD
ncbi:MAG TPA: glutamate synthase central domain-containing protein, partial [Candidatus Acidoferrum sp.]|nr:glutamate synthase central domain-containing protein [Candidatus Acidoferrum sp.]